jgi:T5orf172 domain
MTQYVYLFQTREFFNAKQPIYKIGKTKQPNFTRFSEYPRGSVMLFQSSCYNCHKLEQKIIKLFTTKYELKRSIGTEYFEGDYRKMIRDICDIVCSEEIVDEEIIDDYVEDEDIKNVIVEDVVDSEEIIDDSVVDNVIDSKEVVDLYKYTTLHENGFTKFGCSTCNYSTAVKSNIHKHLSSNKHLLKMTPQNFDPLALFQCKVCNKRYESQSGIWKHSQLCNDAILPAANDNNLRSTIIELERTIIEMAKKI